ncbi:MAG: flippase [Patescibacteria group bacterium]
MVNVKNRKILAEIRVRIVNFKSYLTDNKTVKQTIFKNTFWLGAGTIISRSLKLILVIYVARILGATEYGKFNFALSFVSLFIVFLNLGLPVIVTREFARDKEKEKDFYSVISFKIIFNIAVLILILIGALFLTPDKNVQRVAWVLALFVFIDNITAIFYGFFQARQKMEYNALGEILNALVVAGMGLFIIFNFPSILNLSYAYLLASTVVLIFTLLIFHFKFIPLRFSFQKEVWRKFLFMSWPIVLTGVSATFYNFIDSVMMGSFGQIKETGWYNAAYKIVNIALLPMGLIAGSFFPVLSKFSHFPKDLAAHKIQELKGRLQKVWDYELEIMISIAIPLVVAGIALASRVINFIYGQEFIPAILAFQILIVMAGIIFIYIPFYDILTASGNQKKVFLATFSGAIINIILNLILIPRFSLYGAAAATVVTHSVIFFFVLRFSSRCTPIKPINSNVLFYILTALISSAMMYLAISYPAVYNLNMFISIFIGILIYSAAFTSLRFGRKYIIKVFLSKN